MSLLVLRPSSWGWISIQIAASPIHVGAIPSRLEAIATRVEAIALLSESKTSTS